MRLVLCLVLACVVGTAGASTQPKATLKPFASEREWGELLARWRDAARTSGERRRQDSLTGLSMNAAPAAPQAMAKSAADSGARRPSRSPTCRRRASMRAASSSASAITW